MKKLIFALGLLFLCSNAWANTCTYTGAGDANASTTTNWSGCGGVAPTTGDAVVIDGAFPVTGQDNLTWDIAASFASFNFTGYTGNLTLGANVTSAGSFTLVSGMTFTPSTYTVTFNATSTITSAGKAFYNVTIGASGATFTLADDMTVNNTLTLNEGWSADYTINGNTIKAKGDVTRSGTLWDNINGTTTLSIEGSGTQNLDFPGYNASIQYNCAINLPIIIQSSGDIVFVSGKESFIGGAFTYVSANSVTTTGHNLVLLNSGARTITTGSISWNNVRFENNTGTITLGSNMIVTGTLDFGNNWNGSGGVTYNGYGFLASGNITRGTDAGVLFGAIAGTSTLTIQGSSAQNIDLPGYTNTSSYQFKLPITINKSGSTLTQTGAINYGTGTLTYTAGTFSAGTQTLYISGATTMNTNGLSWYNVAQAANITLGSDLDFSNNFTRTAGAVSGAYYLSPTGSTTHVIDGTNTISGFDCATGETCSFDDADIFTITNGKGNGTWQSDDATNTVDIDFTAETIAYGEGIRVDSAGGVAVTTVGSITDCVNWSDASSPVTTAYTWVG